MQQSGVRVLSDCDWNKFNWEFSWANKL